MEPSPRELRVTLNYAADLPRRTSPVIYMNSVRRSRGPNQVQALYIDFLKVLLIFYCRKVSAKESLVGVLSFEFIGLPAQSQPRGL